MYPQFHEYEPTEAEINRERYWQELQDVEREAQIADEEEKYQWAQELGVTVEHIEVALDEYRCHNAYREAIRWQCAQEYHYDDEIPF